MAMVDISNLSVFELEALKGNIDSVIGNRRQTELSNMYVTFEEMAEAAGFTLEEVMQATTTTKKRVVLPKYQNPNDSTQMWTGRGRKPGWVVEHLAAGGSLDDCLI
ncbi:MAG: H-NS histone family protein [Thiothrix sp.]|jgi:DNA-binding protein H-NS|uniref:H-NS histone family protein n=1 Tax=Thiothrix sp. TaxID=1032 RepID=UPI0026162AF1|nr:H-NS histone family protein [Thiothrix sp.]MDD5394215.1 H-NS histone family protein [Thiothrix sp.]